MNFVDLKAEKKGKVFNQQKIITVQLVDEG